MRFKGTLGTSGNWCQCWVVLKEWIAVRWVSIVGPAVCSGAMVIFWLVQMLLQSWVWGAIEADMARLQVDSLQVLEVRLEPGQMKCWVHVLNLGRFHMFCLVLEFLIRLQALGFDWVQIRLNFGGLALRFECFAVDPTDMLFLCSTLDHHKDRA